MKRNKLALVIMLMAGAIGVSGGAAAGPAADDTSVNSVDKNESDAAESAVSPIETSAPSSAVETTALPADPAAQQPGDSVAAASSIPASAQQPSVTAAPAASSAPAPQETATSVPVQSQPESNQPLPAVNPPVDASSGADKNEPHPAVTAEPQTANVDVMQKPAQTPADKALFTPEQEARIGELAEAWLLKHPELLIEVDQKLQKIQYDEQMKAMITAAIQHQDELLNDRTVPAIGPGDAKVAVIEFFDYQCSICARQAPIIQSLMKNNPQVRFIFKEWPIFGYRWKPSFQAAETGLRIWQQKGGDAYLKYHNALFASGHIEGALTQKDITKAASAAGAGKLKSNDMLGTLSRTDILAKNSGFQGTPGIIVIPVSGATAETVTVFPGGAMESMLQEAINKALSQAAL